MKMAWIWFRMSCKRYLKKPGILLALLLLPVTVWLVGKYVPTEKEGIKIALYLQENLQENQLAESDLEQNWKNMGTGLAEELSNTESLFQFYLCNSEEDLKDQVATGKAECGYVIPEDLGERLRDKKIKNTITLYTSPSTVTGSLSTETVFSALAKLYDRQLLTEYIQDESVGELYDNWYANGNIFHFEYLYGGSAPAADDLGIEIPQQQKNQKSQISQRNTVFPVKGITAVIIFTMSLYSACILEEDEKKGLFATLRYGEKGICQAAMFLALPVLSVCSGALALASGGIMKWEMAEAARQIAGLLFYGGASCLYAWILKCIIRNGKVVFCLIPFFIMGSLIFTPVFVDIGRWLPSVQWIGRIFLPYYYLR